jgi:hypothetical protein
MPDPNPNPKPDLGQDLETNPSSYPSHNPNPNLNPNPNPPNSPSPQYEADARARLVAEYEAKTGTTVFEYALNELQTENSLLQHKNNRLETLMHAYDIFLVACFASFVVDFLFSPFHHHCCSFRCLPVRLPSLKKEKKMTKNTKRN